MSRKGKEQLRYVSSPQTLMSSFLQYYTSSGKSSVIHAIKRIQAGFVKEHTTKTGGVQLCPILKSWKDPNIPRGMCEGTGFLGYFWEKGF